MTDEKAASDGTAKKKRVEFESWFPETAHQLSLLGQRDYEIAKVFGVSRMTLYSWKKKYPKFALAIKQGRDFANGMVASAMYRAAIGGHVEEEVVMKQPDGTKTIGTTRRYIAPDVKAGKFILSSREKAFQPDKQDDDSTRKLADLIVEAGKIADAKNYPNLFKEEPE